MSYGPHEINERRKKQSQTAAKEGLSYETTGAGRLDNRSQQGPLVIFLILQEDQIAAPQFSRSHRHIATLLPHSACAQKGSRCLRLDLAMKSKSFSTFLALRFLGYLVLCGDI